MKHKEVRSVIGERVVSCCSGATSVRLKLLKTGLRSEDSGTSFEYCTRVEDSELLFHCLGGFHSFHIRGHWGVLNIQSVLDGK